jgi:hypothetical protein
LADQQSHNLANGQIQDISDLMALGPSPNRQSDMCCYLVVSVAVSTGLTVPLSIDP